MSELLANLALGFSVAAHPYNIGFCLLGALVGTLVGVLPGIGTVATGCHASADHVWIAALSAL
jgi:putative tricarboxylic transport membrane protein